MAGIEHDPEHDAAGAAARFANPLAVAWRRKGLFALGLAAGLVVGVLYYAQKAPSYQSTAQVLVVKKRPDALPVAGSNLQQTYVEDYMSTHTVLLRSQEILRRAGQVLEADSPGVIPAGADAAAFIAQGLTVTRENRDGNATPSNVLNISFRGRHPEDCPKVVNAVIRAYCDFLADTYGDLNVKFVEQMERARDLLQKDIQRRQEEHLAIIKRNSLAVKARDGLGVLQERINRLEGRRADLLLRKTEIETSQKIIAKALREGQSRAVILKTLERPSASRSPAGEARSVDDVLLALQMQEDELAQELGRDHPQLVALRRRIQLLRDRAGRSSAASDPTRTMDPLELHVQTMARELEENEMLRTTLDELVRVERAEATQMADVLVDEEKARKAIEPYQQLYDNIIARLQQIQLTGEVGGYTARTIVDAGAGVKVAPSLLQTLALAVILGALAGMGLAAAAEWTDRGFHTPEEIRRRLGVPVVAHVPFLPESGNTVGAALDARVRAFHAPTSREAEAFRGLRTALYFSTRGRGHQVIQMTSPNKGDGKSTLLANLAVSIAQSGKSVVLVDADFRRPTLRRLFHIEETESGLAAVLAGSLEWPEAVRPCAAVPGLALVPCGPPPGNPAELLTSRRFQELLGVLRERYDFVLIDTPPLLAVSDPSIVAARVDGVIMALRLSRDCRPPAERAREVLTALGVNILGVVVNGREAHRSPYGFGYQHGYDYGYGEADEAGAVERAAAPAVTLSGDGPGGR